MRSLTMFVAVVVGYAMLLGTASAQETVSNRLTAEVFAEAEFPVEIIEAVQMADEVAKFTEVNRAQAKQWIEQIEPVFDRAVLMLQIPLETFEKLQNSYEAAIQKLIDADRELRQADERVILLYYNWTKLRGSDMDTKTTQVFQKWHTASRLDYVTISEEEEATYRLMLNIGRSKITAGYYERSRNPWSCPAPLTMWKVKNDN